MLLVLLRPHLCLGQFAVADVGSGHRIALQSKTDGLCADAAGAVQNPGGAVKAVSGKEVLQNHRLLLNGGLPVLKQLIVLRGQIVIKSLCNVHTRRSCSQVVFGLLYHGFPLRSRRRPESR